MEKQRSGKQRAAASSKRKAPVLCAAVLGLGALAASLWSAFAPFPRLEVAGFRITQEEYLQAMYRSRNEVLSDHAAAGISLTDWSTETPLGDPLQLTMDRALELLTQYYAVSLLAVERGYLTDAGYEALLQDLEEINRQRQEALQSGGMVTGLPRFTLEEYITYRSSSLRLQFCSDPANPENQVTLEEIRQRYEADRYNLYRQPDSMELAFLAVDAPAGEADALEQTLLTLRQLALEKGALAPALEELPQLKPHYQEISVQPATYGFYSRSHGDILLWASDLQAGDLSEVIRQEDRLYLIHCTERTVQNYVPLEDVQSVVAQSIRESRYDALIAQRMTDLEVDTDLKALYRFTAAQFR